MLIMVAIRKGIDSVLGTCETLIIASVWVCFCFVIEEEKSILTKKSFLFSPDLACSA